MSSSLNTFRKLMGIAFVSQTGSYLLTIALSAFVLASTGSAVKAGLVFVLSYLPSVFRSAQLGAWVDKNISRKLLIRNDLLAIILSIGTALCAHYSVSAFLLALLLAGRSILLFVSRVGLSKWIKVITPPELQTERIKLFYLTFFLSTAGAGILAGLALKETILFVMLIDVITYLCSIAIMLTLDQKPEEKEMMSPQSAPSTSGYFSTLQAIFLAPATKRSFLIVCTTSALFQGAYSVLVSYLPIERFSLGMDRVSAFQLAASVGITLGFVVNWVRPNWVSSSLSGISARTIGVFVLSLMMLVASTALTSLPATLFVFFLMNLGYEVLWLFYSAQFFRASPRESTGRFQFVLHSSSSCLMALSTFVFAFCIQHASPQIAAVYLMLFVLAFTLIAQTWIRARIARSEVVHG